MLFLNLYVLTRFIILRAEAAMFHIPVKVLQTRANLFISSAEEIGNPRFLSNVAATDKTGFALSETLSICNIWQYTPQGNPPPYDYYGSNYGQKINVWCGFCGTGVFVRHFFFENNVNRCLISR